MVENFRPPSRNQLAKIAGGDHEVIRFWEKIFQQVNSITNGSFPVPGADIYDKPYYFAEEPDQSFFYASWQRVDGSGWKAQKYDPATVTIETVTGANPQPSTLTELQALF